MSNPRHTRPAHAPQTHFQTEDNCLLVGGIPVTRLAQRVGATPFFAYDRSLLTSRVAHLRASLPAAIELHYSVKANPMPALVQHMSKNSRSTAVDCSVSSTGVPGTIRRSAPSSSAQRCSLDWT